MVISDMSEYLERAKELRKGDIETYNCAQAVLMSYAKRAGLDEEQAFQIAKNFGGGMKRGATCGVVSAGLMVLGLLGKDNPALVREFYQRLRENHQGQLECAILLQMNKEQGGQKKPHCDGMVFEVVELLEELLSKE